MLIDTRVYIRIPNTNTTPKQKQNILIHKHNGSPTPAESLSALCEDGKGTSRTQSHTKKRCKDETTALQRKGESGARIGNQIEPSGSIWKGRPGERIRSRRTGRPTKTKSGHLARFGKENRGRRYENAGHRQCRCPAVKWNKLDSTRLHNSTLSTDFSTGR